LQNTTAGVSQSVDESVFTMPADTGSNFRIDQQACQYVYNLSATALPVGTYQVQILVSNAVVGTAVFTVK
jgi:hypothetical protein